jgi:hypothetical protein
MAKRVFTERFGAQILMGYKTASRRRSLLAGGCHVLPREEGKPTLAKSRPA